MCIHSLEGAHALVSHPSPPAPPLPLERDCHCLVFLLCLTRYLLSFKKAKTCLHQLNSLAHTGLKLTAISSSHSPFERIVLRRPSFWGSIGRKRLIYQHLIKPTCKRSATDLQTRIIKEGRRFQYSALCHMNAWCFRIAIKFKAKFLWPDTFNLNMIKSMWEVKPDQNRSIDWSIRLNFTTCLNSWFDFQ